MGKRPSEHRSFLIRQQRRFRNFRRRVIGWTVAPLLELTRRIPLPVLRPLLRVVIGKPLYWFYGSAALERIRLALGAEHSEAELRAIVRASCAMLGNSLAETLHASRHGIGEFARRIHNPEALDPLLQWERENERGLIAVTGHIGNWELLGSWVAHMTRHERTLVVAKRMPNPHLNLLIERLRHSLNIETIYQDESPTRAIRGIREGRVIGLIPDQDVKSISGMFIEFFGRPAFTPVGPARIALASKTPIYCVVVVREGDGYRLHVGPPIVPDPSATRAEQIASITREWSRQLEEIIRAHPDQWPWIHDRWKTTPEKLAARGRRELTAS